MPHVIDLSGAHSGLAPLIGSKAATLGELIRHGAQVPPGFCITPDVAVHDAREAILAASDQLGAERVAVRSSATDEDQPDASAAGQHVSVLDVHGPEALFAAIETCRASLHSPRARAYRHAHASSGTTDSNADNGGGTPGSDGDGGRSSDVGRARMAVIVQRMVDVEVAGVLFTANPPTGCRTEMLVEAGPGTTVVDGTGQAERVILYSGDSSYSWLREAGERLQRRFGHPQDIEWATDRSGTRWLLQSRPITTLFPAPPPTPDGEPHIYLEFGHVQGMLQPATPLGFATLSEIVESMLAPLGLNATIVNIGGRLYGDLTAMARHPTARRRLLQALAVDFGPRAQAAMRHILTDPRFAPRRDASRRSGQHPEAPGRDTSRKQSRPRLPRGAVTGIVRALARPEAARARVRQAVDRLRTESEAPTLETSTDRLAWVRKSDDTSAGDLVWPIAAGMLAASVPGWLLRGVATPAEVHATLAGMPHNVTIEMDLALWRLAQRAGEHRELLLAAAPHDLAARYAQGMLPDFGLATFLQEYGHRGPAEVDLGVPRWGEDPAPVFAALAGYLRVTDPEQAPDRRFERAATAAEQALHELTARARRRRPVRGRLAGWLLGRARGLAGLRESGKFAGLFRLRALREQYLLIGADLTAAGLLDDPSDIMFLHPDEVAAAVDAATGHPAPPTGHLPAHRTALPESNDVHRTTALGQRDNAHRTTAHDQRDNAHRTAPPDRRDVYRTTVAARKAVHEREMRRRRVPVALLSDGTDVETLLPRPEEKAGTLRGVGAAAGQASGRARVITDPADARVEPGEILVVTTTDPGWTPLFLTAAALVAETGAIMAHGPTVAREFGIPAVIGVSGATRRIATGQLIMVDGAAGTVQLSETPAAGREAAARG